MREESARERAKEVVVVNVEIRSPFYRGLRGHFLLVLSPRFRYSRQELEVCSSFSAKNTVSAFSNKANASTEKRRQSQKKTSKQNAIVACSPISPSSLPRRGRHDRYGSERAHTVKRGTHPSVGRPSHISLEQLYAPRCSQQ